jgi:signal transduction histidine kinase
VSGNRLHDAEQGGADTSSPGTSGALLGWTERHPRLVDAALAAGALVLLAPSSLQLILGAGLRPIWTVLLTVGVALLQLSIVIRSSCPRLAYGLGCVGMLLLTLSPYLRQGDDQPVPAALLPSAMLFFVLLYSVAERTATRWAVAALSVALLGGLVVLVRLSVGRPWWSSVTGQSEGSAWLVLTALIVAGAVGSYSLGRLRRTRRAYLAELRERARRTEADRVAEAAEAAEGERRRIAREMHDVVSHSLAVMISQAEGGRMLSAAATAPGARPGGSSRSEVFSATVFATIADTGRAALADMRAMLGVLRERDDAAAPRAPQPALADLPALLEQIWSAGCPVQFEESGQRTVLSPSQELTVYRIVQESLTNVVKHAGAGHAARVRFCWLPGVLQVEVTDDGCAVGRGPGGSGLLGMRERVEVLGGSLEVGPLPVVGAEVGRGAGGAGGAGWRVAVRLPTGPGPV